MSPVPIYRVDSANGGVPGFAEIRRARALQGRGRWTRASAGVWFLGLLALIGAAVVDIIRWGTGQAAAVIGRAG